MKIFLRKILLWFLFFGLICATFYTISLHNPTSKSASQDSWSGVLRVWACADAAFGIESSEIWLNSRAAAFEALHSGVRIQITSVDRDVLSSYNTADYPPDILIWTPGMLSETGAISSLSIDAVLIDGLERTGTTGTETKAIPIAMGAYFWIAADKTCPKRPGTDPAAVYTPQAPADSPAHSYSAALLAMYSGTQSTALPQTVYPGADLGLPDASPTQPEDSPPTEPLHRPIAFPDDILSAESVRSMFTSGQADAIVSTPQQLRRIESLASSGKVPDYSVYPGGIPFTDLLAMASLVQKTGPDASETMRLSEEFIRFLLTDESQETLADSYAFRVTQGGPIYPAGRGMSIVEDHLLQGVAAPNAFDLSWRKRASDAAAEFLSTDADAVDLFGTIFR